MDSKECEIGKKKRTDALVVDLRVTVRTGAFVTSGRVDAFVLAVMLSGGAFVEIPA